MQYYMLIRRAHPKAIAIINWVLNVGLMLVSIIGNTLGLAAISRTPSLRSPSMILLCSLAVSDLLVGLVVQPLFIAKELREDLYLLRICYLFLNYAFCGVSLGTVTAISLDRFAALHYHMRYVAIVTKTRVIGTLATIWIVNLLSFSLYLLNKPVYMTSSAGIIVICLLTSSFSYIRIFRIVQRHQLQIHTQQQAVQSSDATNNVNMTRLKKSSMNTFLFFIFLILSYFPMFILMLLFAMSKKDWPKEWNFAVTVVFMNSSINPLLYCWRLGELRTAVVKTAREMLRTNTNQS
ncbi:melanocyte-stimulating hormone receptor-like [Oculina patagonica]